MDFHKETVAAFEPRSRTLRHLAPLVAGALAMTAVACSPAQETYFPPAHPDRGSPPPRPDVGRARHDGGPFNPSDDAGVGGAAPDSAPATPDGAAPDATKDPCDLFESFSKGYCYFTPGFRYMTFNEGRALCRIRGGEVATIENVADNKMIYSMLPYLSYGAWIGLQRVPNGKAFSWLDKSKARFRHWAAGEPNNEKGVERCAIMWGPRISKASLRGRWNDTNCTSPGRDTVVCRRKVKP